MRVVTRRGFLGTAAALAVAETCGSRAFATAIAPVLAAAPIVGHTTENTARIWVQARPATAKEVALAFRAFGQEKWQRTTATVKESAAGTHTFDLRDLSANTAYDFEVFVDGVAGTPVRRFRTAQLAPADFALYMGSCHFPERVSGAGNSYGDAHEIFDIMADAIARERYQHHMLWLGDNLYLRRESRTREADYASPNAMAARYAEVRAMHHLQKLFAATQHYAIWDDHDYGPNNADRHFAYKQTSLDLFTRYWPNPPMGSATLPGTWCSFRQADVEFFLLDDRSYRDAETDAPSANKQMFGTEQLDWLKRGLKTSNARFKVIANGSQLFSELPNGNQSGWHSYATERDDFLAWLRKSDLTGLIFLSGDRHNTQVFKLDHPRGSPMYELSISPFTSRPSKLSKLERANPRLQAKYTVEDRNYATLTFVGPKEARRAVAKCFSAEGKLLWELAVA